MRSLFRGRSLALVVLGFLLGALLFSPAGAHIGGTSTHVWKQHLLDLAKKSFYTKQQTNGNFLRKRIAPGQTVYGTMGSQNYGAQMGDELSANAQLPVPAPVGLRESKVTVNEGQDDGSNTCTGTFRNPTAPPGFACIYPYSEDNVDPTTINGTVWGTDNIKFGFQVSWFTTADGNSAMYATWAYTAPAT